jgi:hypothetical protein
LFIWSSGHLVISCHGHLAIHVVGDLVIWSFHVMGHLAMHVVGHLVIWSFHVMGIWRFMSWVSGHVAIGHVMPWFMGDPSGPWIRAKGID